MKRGKVGKLLNAFENLVINYDRLVELFAAMDNPLADRRDLADIFDHPVFPFGKQLDQLFERFGMGGEILFIGNLDIGSGLMGDYPSNSDPLTVSLCEYLLAFHVDQLILERRTSGIDDQYFHL